MKKALLATVLMASAGGLAQAQSAAPAAEQPFTFSANVGLVSDYRFRGYTQTNFRPAIQGGFDVAHRSGLYLGNWNSNVADSLFPGGNIEMDFYGGYATTLGDVGLDMGVLYYYYPGAVPPLGASAPG